MRIRGAGSLLTIIVALLAGCGGATDLRAYASAYPAAAHMREPVGPPDAAVLAAHEERMATIVLDEQAAALVVARSLSWLEWLRREGWMDRLRGAECNAAVAPEPPPAASADVDATDVIQLLASTPSRPSAACVHARRVLHAVRDSRDALERTPIPGVLGPLRAAIAQLAGPGPVCNPAIDPTTDEVELAAMRHLFELDVYAADAVGCPSLPSVGGHVSLEHVSIGRRTILGPVSTEEDDAPIPTLYGEDDASLRALPAPFRDTLLEVEASLGGRYAAFVQLFLGRVHDEWRVAAEGLQVQVCVSIF